MSFDLLTRDWSTKKWLNHVESKFKIVHIEGNIGAGKTTVLNALEQRGYTVIREPVEKWKFLKKRYEDPKRWMFAFQVEAMTTMVQNIKEQLKHIKETKDRWKSNSATIDCRTMSKPIFIERSLDSYRLFMQIAVEEKLMTQQEYNIIDEISLLLDNYDYVNFYLDCSPEECYRRVKQRNRDGETPSVEYLYKIQDIHHDNHWEFVNSNNDTQTIVEDILSRLTVSVNEPCDRILSKID